MPDFSSQAFLRELDKKLWTAADKPRSNLDAAVYKHAALGLIFLKYVSDSFAERQSEIEAMRRDPENYFYVNPAAYRSPAKYEEAIHQELEERDYYIEKNVFWVPALARWKTLQDSARLRAGTEITVKNGKVSKYKITSTGKLIDDAMEAVEKENPKLKNVPVASVSTVALQNTPLAPASPIISKQPAAGPNFGKPATIEDGGPRSIPLGPSIADRHYSSRSIRRTSRGSSTSSPPSRLVASLCQRCII